MYCLNIDFRFHKITRFTRYTSPAVKQVGFGPVKCATCTDFLAKEEHFSATTRIVFVTTFCLPDGICTKECGQFSRNDTCHHLEFCRFFKLQYKRPDSSQWCLFKAHFFFRRRRNRANVDTTNAKIRQEK